MSMTYTVFMDESFDGFMNLSKDNGFFCYAALTVPTSKLPDLDRFWAANRNRLIEAYKHATGFEIQDEFKSGFLNKLNFQTRRDFGEKLAYFLAKNECYVAGYYTTVRNLLAYHVRTEVAKNDATDLPSDWEAQLAGVKLKLLGDKPNHPGDAHLLVGLFHQTLSIVLNWMAAAGSSFKVLYDPRQKKEDKFLIRHSDDWLTREAEVKGLKGVYSGITNTVTSVDSAGLMLVDLIVRDVRFLFSDVPELLTEQSCAKLVLPVPQGYEPVVMSLQGIKMKWGDRHPMSEDLKKKLRAASPNSMLPLYVHQLAGKKLSCEAAFGESRVINFALGCFEDMTD